MHLFITSSLESWASFYSNHGAVRTIIDFLHIAGLMLAGGFAVVADRATLVAAKGDDKTKAAQLEWLRSTHPVVIVSLSAVIISGVLLFAADSDTFLHSVFFWIKIAFFVLLMANGAILTRAEVLARRNDPRGWTQLRWTSAFSIVLWLLTTLAGSALPNVS
jgi:uncharacterized membrane protein